MTSPTPTPLISSCVWSLVQPDVSQYFCTCLQSIGKAWRSEGNPESCLPPQALPVEKECSIQCTQLNKYLTCSSSKANQLPGQHMGSSSGPEHMAQVRSGSEWCAQSQARAPDGPSRFWGQREWGGGWALLYSSMHSRLELSGVALDC